MSFVFLNPKLNNDKVRTLPRLIGFLSGIIIGILLVFSGHRLFFYKKVSIQPLPEVLSSVNNPVSSAGQIPGNKSLGILLLGYGGDGHSGGNLTDAIQVLFIDFEKAKVNLISIPRDLWVKLPDGHQAKVNTVFGKLKVEESKNFIGNLLGLTLDYFVGIDFVGFQRAVGINLKGIVVEVGETLEDPWYPVQGRELDTCGMSADEITQLSLKFSGFELERQFPCRYEKLYYPKGLVKMQGGEALKYVRSRHGSSAGDLSRNIRQQEVLTAIKKKILTLDVLPDLPGFFNEIVTHLNSDIDLQIVNFLAPAIKNAAGFSVNYINLSTDNVLISGNAGPAAVIRPKSGINNYAEIRSFIREKTL